MCTCMYGVIDDLHQKGAFFKIVFRISEIYKWVYGTLTQFGFYQHRYEYELRLPLQYFTFG